MKKKKIFIILFLLCLFMLTSCNLRNEKNVSNVDTFVNRLQNKYPDLLCWGNGWYETSYYEIEYIDHSYQEKFIDVNCSLKLNSLTKNMEIKQFTTNKRVVNSKLIVYENNLYDGSSLYVDHKKQYFYEEQPRSVQYLLLQEDISLMNFTPFGSINRIIFMDKTFAGHSIQNVYKVIKYDNINHQYQYQIFCTSYRNYEEHVFYFDDTLKLLKYSCTVENKKDYNEETNEFDYYKKICFSVVPSEFIEIVTPTNVQNNYHTQNSSYNWEAVFCNTLIGGGKYYV